MGRSFGFLFWCLAPLLVLSGSVAHLFFTEAGLWTLSQNRARGHTNSTSATFSPNAYATIIAGCEPNGRPHRGMFYNLLVAKVLLKKLGSRAHVVALFQMSASSNATELDKDESRILSALEITAHYLPPNPHQSFYETMLDKFRALDLTQYRRVIVMDADVMPLSNMDYLFELSDGPLPVLKPNLIVTGVRNDAAHGGFFMLSPGPTEFQQIQMIISKREADAVKLTNNCRFDEVKGWGHVITPPDQWETRGATGRLWDFMFACLDPGLLLYWTKYYKRSVSIVIGSTVKNIEQGPNGTVIVERELHDPFRNYSYPILEDERAKQKWMGDFRHFSGRSKPWNQQPPPNYLTNPYESSLNLWYSTLHNISERFDMKLNFTYWKAPSSPPLGYWAPADQVRKRLERLARTRLSSS